MTGTEWALWAFIVALWWVLTVGLPLAILLHLLGEGHK